MGKQTQRGQKLFAYMVVFQDGGFQAGYCMAHEENHVLKHFGGDDLSVISILRPELDEVVVECLTEIMLDFSLDKNGNEISDV